MTFYMANKGENTQLFEQEFNLIFETFIKYLNRYIPAWNSLWVLVPINDQGQKYSLILVTE